jgi:hypothetical protein
VVYPLLSIRVVRVIFAACCVGLSLIVLLMPEVIDGHAGISRFACDFGNNIPIVRTLNARLRGCYLSAGYGAATILGFAFAPLYCLTRFPKPLQLNVIIPASRASRIAMIFLMACPILLTWFARSNELTPPRWMLMSSNRFAASLFAPLFFGVHLLSWSFLFLIAVIGVRKQRARRNNLE